MLPILAAVQEKGRNRITATRSCETDEMALLLLLPLALTLVGIMSIVAFSWPQ
jgi:hypothetical protein